MAKIGLFIMAFLSAISFQMAAAELRHYPITSTKIENPYFIWKEQDIQPFDELIISWDAQRTPIGHYCIQISLFTDKWSPWFDYAVWATKEQHTFDQCSSDGSIKVYQDTIELLQEKKATGFQVRVEAKNGASLIAFRRIHASTVDLGLHRIESTVKKSSSISLDVPGLSQMALPDERCMRLCSPTSTTAVIQYLSRSKAVQPLYFADRSFDSAFNIYGNWIFTTAQASHELGASWSCCVARLTHFDQILEQLYQGLPVVVSVQGALPGSREQSYNSGHLLVVRGYNACTKRVLCMDPAFEENHLTHVEYALEDFIQAWQRRHGLAYIFQQVHVE